MDDINPCDVLGESEGPDADCPDDGAGGGGDGAAGNCPVDICVDVFGTPENCPVDTCVNVFGTPDSIDWMFDGQNWGSNPFNTDGGSGGGGTGTCYFALASPCGTPPDPCATNGSDRQLSMGTSVSGAMVNPFTTAGGGVWGYNEQSFGATTNSYTYSGTGIGLDFGGSIQSVWALGSGSWSGPFRSVNVSAGVFSGSVFWTPGTGGWVGFSFGLGLGLPGLAIEKTNYTCKPKQD